MSMMAGEHESPNTSFLDQLGKEHEEQRKKIKQEEKRDLQEYMQRHTVSFRLDKKKNIMYHYLSSLGRFYFLFTFAVLYPSFSVHICYFVFLFLFIVDLFATVINVFGLLGYLFL